MKYYKQLDALRFYSVAWVVLTHIPLFPLPAALTYFLLLLPGVQMFFCISGFLITMIVLQNSHQKSKRFFRSFYIRRALRIFPLYYLVVLALAAFNFQDYRHTWLFYDFFYLSNIQLGSLGSFDHNLVSPHFWSLAVEEQFYLLWPGILFLCNKKNYRYVLGIFLFGIGLVSILFSGSFFVMRTIGNLSFLMSGCTIAIVLHYKGELSPLLMKRTNQAFTLGMAFLALLAVFNVPLSNTLSILLTVFLVPVVLLKFVVGFRNPFAKLLLENRPVVYLGKISYGIYVYHMLALYPLLLIQKLSGINLSGDPFLTSAAKIIITLLISVLSWELFEKRLIRLKSNYKYITPPLIKLEHQQK